MAAGIVASSLVLLLASPAARAQDTDGDTVLDPTDNCVEVPNPSQTNGDFDRFGNLCDGDLNNDGATDSSDQTLLEQEIAAPEPVSAADLNDDGFVDALDLDYFGTDLVGESPGPAGPSAHDADGDGVLDFCTLPSIPPSFPGAWDPAQQPNLLTNGLLASASGGEPDGWDPVDLQKVAYRQDMALSGVYQWLPTGGSGGASRERCDRACVAPAKIPVTFGHTYAFSFFSCAVEYPPTTLSMQFDEYDGADVGLGVTDGLVNDKAMPSGTGYWEETLAFYTPSSAEVATVRPLLTRVGGPAPVDRNFFATDFAFWELPVDGTRSYRQPPAPKQSFDGMRTRVDSLGNVEVFDPASQLWEPFFPIGVFGKWQRDDFTFYTDMGFNTYMNDRGVNAAAPRAVAAGMRFLVIVDGLWNPASYPNVAQMLPKLALDAIDPSGQSVPVYDSLLGFLWDNENFRTCLKPAGGGPCVVPYTTPWNGSVDPQAGLTAIGALPEILAFDRAQNGGARGVPIYYLNGNPNVARAYSAFSGETVNVEGDVRMDITGSYRVNRLEQLQRAANQPAPAVFVQIQGHHNRRFFPIAWGGIARGARGISTWRDEPLQGYFLRAPVLRICGTNLPSLQERGTLSNPTGTIVKGSNSQAEAEILLDRGAWSDGCVTGEIGREYFIKMQAGAAGEQFFAPGEPLVDAAGGSPLGDARVVEVAGDYEVLHVGSLDQFAWTDELPAFRDSVAALLPIIRADHKTEWQAVCEARLANVPGNPMVSFGDNGIVCGGRTLDDVAYLFLTNEYAQVDPFAPYLAQQVGETLTVDVTLSNVPFPIDTIRYFDFTTNSFGSSTPLATNQFSVTLPPFGVALVALPEPSTWLAWFAGCVLLAGLRSRRRVGNTCR